MLVIVVVIEVEAGADVAGAALDSLPLGGDGVARGSSGVARLGVGSMGRAATGEPV